MSRWMKVAAMACAAVVAGGVSAAEISLGDRVGKVLAAEVSSAPITVYQIEDHPGEGKFADCRYIVVTIELTEYRSISLVDYSLTLAGKELPCIAVAHKDDDFLVDPLAQQAHGRDRIRLLFIADGSTIGDAAVLEGVLTTTLPGRESSIAVPIANLGEKTLTPAAKIPAEGTF